MSVYLMMQVQKSTFSWCRCSGRENDKIERMKARIKKIHPKSLLSNNFKFRAIIASWLSFILLTAFYDDYDPRTSLIFRTLHIIRSTTCEEFWVPSALSLRQRRQKYKLSKQHYFDDEHDRCHLYESKTYWNNINPPCTSISLTKTE